MQIPDALMICAIVKVDEFKNDSMMVCYGPYISSSRTTRKRYKQTSSRSAGGTRTSRTIGRGVAELYDVTRLVRNVGT
jgi:hypothetical protein